jgi:DNA polymerase I
MKSRSNLWKVESNIEPYCFIRERDLDKVVYLLKSYRVEKSDLVNFEKEKVVKIIADVPEQIGKLNQILQKKGIMTYEADIPYVRRYMIDKDIPIKTDMSKIYFDFEAESDVEKDVGEWKIKSVALIDDKGKEYYYASSSEKELISFFLDTIKNYDLVIGWNSDNFDLYLLESAMKRHNIKENLRKRNTFIDLMEGYKSYSKGMTKGISNFKLDVIADFELGERKRDIEKSIIMKPYSQLSTEEREKLREYNLRDSLLVKKIDEKCGITDIRTYLASLGYVFVDETFSITKLIDSILLKKYRDYGYVLPSVKLDAKKEKYTGAFVKDYAKGIFENVAVYDVSSLYPNVIVQFRISPERERTILPSLIEETYKKRKEAKKEYAITGDKRYDYMQYALKILMNATYGYFGTSISRLYSNLIATSITGYGRMVVRKMIEYFESKGLNVIFADTDSSAVVLPKFDVNIAEEHRKKVEQYIKEKLGKTFEIKLEKIFGKIYLTGVKKRYVGFVVWKDGKKLDKRELNVTGFEMIRGDWFDLAKEVENKIFDIILSSSNFDDAMKEIREMLKEVKRDLYDGKYDSKLVFSISNFRKNPKVKTRSIKAIEELKRNNIKLQSGQVLEYVVGRGNKIIPLVDGKPIYSARYDYDFYWKRIEDLVERIAGVKFEKNRKLFD